MSSSHYLLAAVDLGDKLKIGDGTTPYGASYGRSVGMYYGSFSSFINLLLPLSFVLAGIIFLFLLIGGGFAIIASGGNAKNVEQGKNQILTAVIGFVIIFAAYWIIQLIEIVTGVSILNGSQNF